MSADGSHAAAAAALEAARERHREEVDKLRDACADLKVCWRAGLQQKRVGNAWKLLTLWSCIQTSCVCRLPMLPLWTLCRRVRCVAAAARWRLKPRQNWRAKCLIALLRVLGVTRAFCAGCDLGAGAAAVAGALNPTKLQFQNLKPQPLIPRPHPHAAGGPESAVCGEPAQGDAEEAGACCPALVVCSLQLAVGGWRLVVFSSDAVEQSGCFSV